MKWADALIPPTEPAACWEQRETGQRAGKVVKQSGGGGEKKRHEEPALGDSAATEALQNNHEQQLHIR